MRNAPPPYVTHPASAASRAFPGTLGALLGALLLGSLPAQDQGERVELRVLGGSNNGTVAVDRGKADGLAVGDAVLFRPRTGGEARGTVIRTDERTATVQMLDRAPEPPPGTRGEVFVPAARRPQAQPTTPEPDAPPPPTRTDHPEWQNKDEGFTRDQPLLAQVKPIDPRARLPQFGGRFFTFADLQYSEVDQFANSLVRTGVDTWLDNPFGRGGSLRFDGDLNYRTEQNDVEGADLTVRELSYQEGGTRFQPARWQVGRFLQTDVPQFGILDGFAWSQRRPGGDTFGASIGFLPELDDDMHTGEDLQLAAFYRWVNDESETLSATAAFQKTFHQGKSDRDLLVLDARRLPVDGWDLRTSLWIDFYTGGARDAAKGSGPELTHAFASAGRRFEGGSGFDLSYRRLRFPALLRTTHVPITPDEIRNDRYDRLALAGWALPTTNQRAHGELALFDDEDTDGAALELGLDTQEVLLERGHLDVTVFGSAGRFGSTVGGRITLGRTTDNGRYDVVYEAANHHFDGFTADRDDLIQHRVHGTRTFDFDGGWSLTAHAGAWFWDSETAWSTGFYLQRAF